jgi:hypothetical protein
MSLADEIVARIDRDTLVQFALEICNIDSAVPFEAEVAEHLYQWLKREGFIARRVGLLSDSLAPPGSIIYHSANRSSRPAFRAALNAQPSTLRPRTSMACRSA